MAGQNMKYVETNIGVELRTMRAELSHEVEQHAATRDRAERAEAKLKEMDWLHDEVHKHQDAKLKAEAALAQLMDYHATCHGGTEDTLRAERDDLRAQLAAKTQDHDAEAYAHTQTLAKLAAAEIQIEQADLEIDETAEERDAALARVRELEELLRTAPESDDPTWRKAMVDALKSPRTK